MIKEFVKLEVFEDGKPKPISKLQTGDQWWKKEKKWINKVRLIDRKNDLYRETITDPQTGEVVHHTDHPLGEHQGHGSARQKAQP